MAGWALRVADRDSRVAVADSLAFCPTCENTGLHPPGDPDGLGCWDCWRMPASDGAERRRRG